MTATLAAVDFGQGVEDAFSDVAAFVPKFVAFLAILVIGMFIAKSIAKIVDKALERLGFDKAVERGGIKKALANSKYDASSIVGKIVYYALFLLVLQLAFGVFGQNPVSDLITGIIAYLPKVFAAIVIFVVASAIAAGVKEIVSNSLSGMSYGEMAGKAAATAIVVLGAFAALDQLQIAQDVVDTLFTGLIVAVVGIAIVAVGGGGIAPMRARWENALDRMSEETDRVRQDRAQRAQAPVVDLVEEEARPQTTTRSGARTGRARARR